MINKNYFLKIYVYIFFILILYLLMATFIFTTQHALKILYIYEINVHIFFRSFTKYRTIAGLKHRSRASLYVNTSEKN